ncbi:MAG: hypothetical protein IH595_03490 [Bacteroidales bacterium]|nr:hypothetical protein [Bacteroidales bacterium]
MGFVYEKHSVYPNSVLVRRFVETTATLDIIDSWNYLIDNNLVTESLKGLITDLSSCELSMDMTSFKTLISFMRNQDYLKKLKLAVVCGNPKTIVFPLLGEREETDLRIRPFSTMEAAANWIMFEP